MTVNEEMQEKTGCKMWRVKERGQNAAIAQRAKRWEDERHPGATVICRKSSEKQRAPFSQVLYAVLNSSNGL